MKTTQILKQPQLLHRRTSFLHIVSSSLAPKNKTREGEHCLNSLNEEISPIVLFQKVRTFNSFQITFLKNSLLGLENARLPLLSDRSACPLLSRLPHGYLLKQTNEVIIFICIHSQTKSERERNFETLAANVICRGKERNKNISCCGVRLVCSVS